MMNDTGRVRTMGEACPGGISTTETNDPFGCTRFRRAGSKAPVSVLCHEFRGFSNEKTIVNIIISHFDGSIQTHLESSLLAGVSRVSHRRPVSVGTAGRNCFICGSSTNTAVLWPFSLWPVITRLMGLKGLREASDMFRLSKS